MLSHCGTCSFAQINISGCCLAAQEEFPSARRVFLQVLPVGIHRSSPHAQQLPFRRSLLSLHFSHRKIPVPTVYGCHHRRSYYYHFAPSFLMHMERSLKCGTSSHTATAKHTPSEAVEMARIKDSTARFQSHLPSALPAVSNNLPESLSSKSSGDDAEEDLPQVESTSYVVFMVTTTQFMKRVARFNWTVCHPLPFCRSVSNIICSQQYLEQLIWQVLFPWSSPFALMCRGIRAGQVGMLR